jgi:hypothetical protein
VKILRLIEERNRARKREELEKADEVEDLLSKGMSWKMSQGDNWKIK